MRSKSMVGISIDMLLDAPNFWRRVQEIVDRFQTIDIFIMEENLSDCEREFLDEQMKIRCDNCPYTKRGWTDDGCRERYSHRICCPKIVRWRSV